MCTWLFSQVPALSTYKVYVVAKTCDAFSVAVLLITAAHGYFQAILLLVGPLQHKKAYSDISSKEEKSYSDLSDEIIESLIFFLNLSFANLYFFILAVVVP